MVETHTSLVFWDPIQTLDSLQGNVKKKNHCHSTFQPINQPSCTHPPSQPTNPPLPLPPSPPPPPTRLLLACLDGGPQGTGTTGRREHLLSWYCWWYYCCCCCCCCCSATGDLVTVSQLSGGSRDWTLMVGIKLACGSLTSPPGLANLTSGLHKAA